MAQRVPTGDEQAEVDRLVDKYSVDHPPVGPRLNVVVEYALTHEEEFGRPSGTSAPTAAFFVLPSRRDRLSEAPTSGFRPLRAFEVADPLGQCPWT